MSDFHVLQLPEDQPSRMSRSFLRAEARTRRLLRRHAVDQLEGVGLRAPDAERLGAESQRARRGRSFPLPPHSRPMRRDRRRVRRR